KLFGDGPGIRRGHFALFDEIIEAGLDLVLCHHSRAQPGEKSLFECFNHDYEVYADMWRRANRHLKSASRFRGSLGFLVRLPQDREELLGAAALVALHVPED